MSDDRFNAAFSKAVSIADQLDVCLRYDRHVLLPDISPSAVESGKWMTVRDFYAARSFALHGLDLDRWAHVMCLPRAFGPLRRCTTHAARVVYYPTRWLFAAREEWERVPLLAESRGEVVSAGQAAQILGVLPGSVRQLAYGGYLKRVWAFDGARLLPMYSREDVERRRVHILEQQPEPMPDGLDTLSVTEVCAALGRGRTTVGRWVRRMGIRLYKERTEYGRIRHRMRREDMERIRARIVQYQEVVQPYIDMMRGNAHDVSPCAGGVA